MTCPNTNDIWDYCWIYFSAAVMAAGEAALFDMLRVTGHGINKWKCYGISRLKYTHIWIFMASPYRNTGTGSLKDVSLT